MVISSVRVVLDRLSGGIIFNIHILRTRLEERACSAPVELDGAKVNFREVFYSVHTKVFKASRVVGAQQISELFRGSELHYNVFFCLLRRVLSSSFLF